MSEPRSFDSVPWRYDTKRVSQDKRTARPGTAPKMAYEILGMDGSIHGGLRPFPGMLRVHDLDFWADENHDARSTVIDCFPIDFMVCSEHYAYGLVYKVQRSPNSGSDLADVFLDYWNSGEGIWTTGVKLVDSVAADSHWDVTTAGRFIFVFVRGRSPVLAFMVCTNEATVGGTSSSSSYVSTDYTLRIIGTSPAGPNPGPGKQPYLVSPESAEPLGSYTPQHPRHARRPGAGQIVLTRVEPCDTGLLDVLPEAASSESTPSSASTPSSSSSSSSSGEPCVYPTGYRTLEPGDYTFLYQLFDSRTGRRSAPSFLAQCRYEDFFRTVLGESSSSGPTVTQVVDPRFAALELVYDRTKFDTCLVFRSVKTQDAGGTFSSQPRFVDAIITLADYDTNLNGTGRRFDPAVTIYNHMIYYYELEDKILMAQDAYFDSMWFDEDMPYGGTAETYETTLIVGDIKQGGQSTEEENRKWDTERGLGELRWSSLLEPSYELYAPISRYVPKVPSNRVIRLERCSGHVLGWSLDRVYHIRKETQFIHVEEVHEGYGISNPEAADSIGSAVYYLNPMGLKLITTKAALDDIQAFDWLVQNDWDVPGDSVFVAHDPHVNVAVVHNATKKHAALLWLSTGMATELYDMDFVCARRGSWPVRPTDYGSALTQRAVFVQNSPEIFGIKNSFFMPRVYVIDRDRTKVITGSTSEDGNPRMTMLDINGDTRLTVTGYNFATKAILTAPAAILPTNAAGAQIYVTDAADPTLIGKKATLYRTIAPNLILTADEGWGNLDGLVAGDRIMISPIYCRWIGRPLEMKAEGGIQFAEDDDFREKTMETLNCVFSDVVGPPAQAHDPGLANADPHFRALVYKGGSDDIEAWAIPVSVKQASAGQHIRSIRDGKAPLPAAFTNDATYLSRTGVQGSVLAPGVEIICCDMDFRLLQVLVQGKILSSLQEELDDDV